MHPSVKAQRVLNNNIKQFLRSNNYSAKVRTVRRLRVLTRLSPGNPDLLVLYYHLKKIRPVQLAGLQQYVYSGGRVLAVHSATASFKAFPSYFEVLGGKFDGHGPVEKFEVAYTENDMITSDNSDASKHPASLTKESVQKNQAFSVTGVPDFSNVPKHFTTVDELYLHRFFGTVQVYFRASGASADKVPVVWGRKYGKGTVFYCVFGHTAESISSGPPADVILSGIKWLLQ